MICAVVPNPIVHREQRSFNYRTTATGLQQVSKIRLQAVGDINGGRCVLAQIGHQLQSGMWTQQCIYAFDAIVVRQTNLALKMSQSESCCTQGTTDHNQVTGAGTRARDVLRFRNQTADLNRNRQLPSTGIAAN